MRAASGSTQPSTHHSALTVTDSNTRTQALTTNALYTIGHFRNGLFSRTPGHIVAS